MNLYNPLAFATSVCKITQGLTTRAFLPTPPTIQWIWTCHTAVVPVIASLTFCNDRYYKYSFHTNYIICSSVYQFTTLNKQFLRNKSTTRDNQYQKDTGKPAKLILNETFCLFISTLNKIKQPPIDRGKNMWMVSVFPAIFEDILWTLEYKMLLGMERGGRGMYVCNHFQNKN